ncbi:MAG: helix-hairpin-helix domain-containing protein, partial [Deltaproteobacteria bacterium]|nr:helix-hairpin-helix domain-containing protein [Deltaproteobacteria bacterium]
AFSYFTESAWRDMRAQCPPGAAPTGCLIEGVSFDEDQASCAQQLFVSMTCVDCMVLFDSRVCEDAFNDPNGCQSGTTCTGCTDGDSRENGVTCEEIATYSYFGPTAAQALYEHVLQHPCGGSCTPVCDGRACGDDGCGDSCGTCATGETCDPTGQCAGGSCSIEGVFFDALKAECAEVFFESMDCATCGALLDSRTCEDAIEDPAACQSGDTCTGCADGDTRNDGVTCEEIATYAYFGTTSAQKLLDYVKADPSCGVPELVVEGVPLTPEQAADILAVSNDATVDQLDTGAGLDARAAQNIVAARPLATIEQLAAVTYVGKTAIERLRDYAPQWSPGEPPSQVSVQALADEVATNGEASTWLGTTVIVDRAIVTSTPIAGASGYVKFDIADPSAGHAEQLLVYVAASATQDTAWLSLFDDVALVGTFTRYGTTFEIALTDPAVHSLSLNKSGLQYDDYETVQAAWRSTAANPEGAVRVVSGFGYTYMVPLPLFQHHPMWGGTPPGPPSNSGNEQDYNWLIAAQDALDAWISLQ